MTSAAPSVPSAHRARPPRRRKGRRHRPQRPDLDELGNISGISRLSGGSTIRPTAAMQRISLWSPVVPPSLSGLGTRWPVCELCAPILLGLQPPIGSAARCLAPRSSSSSSCSVPPRSVDLLARRCRCSTRSARLAGPSLRPAFQILSDGITPATGSAGRSPTPRQLGTGGACQAG